MEFLAPLLVLVMFIALNLMAVYWREHYSAHQFVLK
jgi:hypothetical protein